MAGVGIRGGASHGETEEVGYKEVVNAVSVPAVHASILYLLGVDHARLTSTHNGRLYLLTDGCGEVIRSSPA